MGQCRWASCGVITEDSRGDAAETHLRRPSAAPAGTEDTRDEDDEPRRRRAKKIRNDSSAAADAGYSSRRSSSPPAAPICLMTPPSLAVPEEDERSRSPGAATRPKDLYIARANHNTTPTEVIVSCYSKRGHCCWYKKKRGSPFDKPSEENSPRRADIG